MGHLVTFVSTGIILSIWVSFGLCDDWCSEPGADCEMKNASLWCRGEVLEQYLNYSSDELKDLLICHLEEPVFNPGIINIPTLLNLSVVHSNVSMIVDSFPEHQHLQMLNLSSLKLNSLEYDIFKNLHALQILDLSFNNFHHLGADVFPHYLTHIYLRGNPWNCSSDLRWIAKKNKVVDSGHMLCGRTKYFAKPVVSIMNFVNNLERECPKIGQRECQCRLDNVVWSQTAEFLIPVTTVNCSHLQLEKLPLNLPSNTTVLLLNNNNISDLSPIVSDKSYHRVADIYLDNNVVASDNIKKLEGAVWLNNFRVLSLRANKIQVLPTYAFDNAFEKNNHAVKVYFGKNPWKCDCTFTPAFKDLLAKHHTLIQDVNDIRCSNIEADDNSMVRIKDVSRNTVCYDAGEFWLSSMDVLNLFLAFLIFLTVGKFLYDYWMYKTTGKLPWIAMRLL